MYYNKSINWVRILEKASKAGKEAILKNYDLKKRREILRRGAGGDFTLKIDEASETAIHASLKKSLGKESFVFVSEELGEVEKVDDEPRPVIICDPLDGSHNAQVGIPLFSLALSVLGLNRRIRPKEKRFFRDIDVGLVKSITTNDEFTAIRNSGSFHNNRLLNKRTSFPKQIETLLVECGDIECLHSILSHFTTKQIYKTRILGSAALSFCLLADGTSDAFIFVQPGGARSIDSPAGYLIAKEAGCAFTNLLDGRELEEVDIGFGSRVNILGASNKKVLAYIEKIIRK